MSRLCKGEGSEESGEGNSGLLLLSAVENTDSFFHFVFFCPGPNRKSALCLPECSQSTQFPVQRALFGKQKQTGSEEKKRRGAERNEGWKDTDVNGGVETHGSYYQLLSSFIFSPSELKSLPVSDQMNEGE